MVVETAERLVFSNFEFKRFPNGLCRAEVELVRHGTEKLTGVAQGSGSTQGSLRTSALASVDALQKAIPDGVTFELLGVKATGAFDSTIVIVSVAANSESGAQRLVGSFVSDEDRERSAAIAVLNATNRYLEKDFFSRT